MRWGWRPPTSPVAAMSRNVRTRVQRVLQELKQVGPPASYESEAQP
jgi:hypothetical protein